MTDESHHICLFGGGWGWISVSVYWLLALSVHIRRSEPKLVMTARVSDVHCTKLARFPELSPRNVKAYEGSGQWNYELG